MASLAPIFSIAHSTSFFRDRIIAELREVSLYTDVAGIVADYTKQNLFGAADWKRQFNIDVGPKIPFGEEVDKFWQGLDPVDVFNRVPNPRYVWETHLRPVFGFEYYKDLQNNTHARSLDTLNQLGLKFADNNTMALQWYRNKAAAGSCLLVMRKDVLARNKSWSDQQQFLRNVNAATGAGYEVMPSAVDLGTVLLPSIVEDKEYHLGTSKGAEGKLTHSRCEEVIEYGEIKHPVVFGGSYLSGVWVDTLCVLVDDCVGVAALKKFRL